MRHHRTHVWWIPPILVLVSGCAPSAVQIPEVEPTLMIVSGNGQGVPVGQRGAEPLTVGVFNGAPVAGARVAWSVTFGNGILSADTTMSLASGVSQVWYTAGTTAGFDTVTATLVGTTQAVKFAVEVIAPEPPPVASCATEPWSAINPDSDSWPNQPADVTWTIDEPFGSLGQIWQVNQRQTINGSGVTMTQDSTAPLSPPGVLQFTYGEGFPAGYEPGVAYYDLATPVKEAYFGFLWKASDPWQNNTNSGANKIAFLMTTATSVHGDIFIMMFNLGTGYTLQVEPEFPGDTRRLAPNITATPVALGVWHRIEWYAKYSSTDTTSDGETRWWLDGVLQGSYTDLRMPGDPGFREYQLAPTWGGVIGTKEERDFFCFDHVHASAR